MFWGIRAVATCFSDLLGLHTKVREFPARKVMHGGSTLSSLAEFSLVFLAAEDDRSSKLDMEVS